MLDSNLGLHPCKHCTTQLHTGSLCLIYTNILRQYSIAQGLNCVYLSLDLKSWSSCLHLPSSRMTYLHHYPRWLGFLCVCLWFLCVGMCTCMQVPKEVSKYLRRDRKQPLGVEKCQITGASSWGGEPRTWVLGSEFWSSGRTECTLSE